MDVKDFMHLLQSEIHSGVLATNDSQGRPSTSYMDVMHTDVTCINFLTFKEKEIYHRMTNCGYAALIRMRGTEFFQLSSQYSKETWRIIFLLIIMSEGILI